MTDNTTLAHCPFCKGPGAVKEVHGIVWSKKYGCFTCQITFDDAEKWNRCAPPLSSGAHLAAPASAAQDALNSSRYLKLRGWMSNSEKKGHEQVEHLEALARYVGWDLFDAYLDRLPECNVGLVNKPFSGPGSLLNEIWDRGRSPGEKWSLKLWDALTDEERDKASSMPYTGNPFGEGPDFAADLENLRKRIHG